MSLRKPRDPKDPLQGEIVRTGCWNRFKLFVLCICGAINTLACPAASTLAIFHMIIKQKVYKNPYSMWMFTFGFMSFIPLFAMIANFNRFGKNCCFLCQKGPYSVKRWKRDLFTKKVDKNDVEKTLKQFIVESDDSGF